MTEYFPQIGDKVHVLGQTGEFEVVDPADEGQVLVRLIGTHEAVEYRKRFPRKALKPIKPEVTDQQ
jgi:hypothetical protein